MTELKIFGEKIKIKNENKNSIKDKIKKRLKKYTNAKIIINPELPLEIYKGGQYFGDGGYYASFKILAGNAEVMEKSTDDNGFRRKTYYEIIKITKKPFVIYHNAHDLVGGVRCFANNLYIFL